MDYLVTMTTHVPEGTPDEAVDDVRAREAARSRELAAQGHLLRLWRPPLRPGEWRTLGLFAAADGGELEQVLASMPLRVWRTDEVTPLAPHRNDPGPGRPPAGRRHGVLHRLHPGRPGRARPPRPSRTPRRARPSARTTWPGRGTWCGCGCCPGRGARWACGVRTAARGCRPSWSRCRCTPG